MNIVYAFLMRMSRVRLACCFPHQKQTFIVLVKVCFKNDEGPSFSHNSIQFLIVIHDFTPGDIAHGFLDSYGDSRIFLLRVQLQYHKQMVVMESNNRCQS